MPNAESLIAALLPVTLRPLASPNLLCGNLVATLFLSSNRTHCTGFPPKLSGASRGNLGLMDQIAALHWIKDNIESFGGSAGNVTLMGTRRAAIFVNLLMLSPLAKGELRESYNRG